MTIIIDNYIPIYIQLVEQIKIDIISSKLIPGERLMSVREYALDMKVNPNTMQKALVELEEIGLIFTERTNGKFVTNDQKLINKYKKIYAEEISLKYFMNMESIGFNKEEVISYLEKLGENK